MRFDENLRILRKEKDYSQEYLAEKLGVTRQTISKWENGTAMPDLKKLIELADFFEVSMDDLLGLDYKTINPESNIDSGSCNDYNEAEAILANRYTNELIHSAHNQIDSKTKVLSIFLAVVSIAFVISVISFSGKIGSLENQINGLNASYAYLSERINSNGGQNYDGDDYYDVEVTILKTYSETPYVVQAELKYAPSSYPKNSKIYYLLPKKDGVDRLSAQENNGEFVAEADIDLSLDKPVYFVLDDGENVIKQEVYLGIEDVLGTVNSDITYGINEKSKNEFLFTNSETYVWNNSKYTKLNSADLVVAADGKEVYRQALKKSELKYDETNEIFDSFYEIDLPTFYIKDLKEPKKFDIYVEVKLDNGVLCKSHLEYNSSMYYPNEGMEENLSYIEYIFSVGDKTVTIKSNKQ